MASVSDLILNFIKMNKIGIKLIQDSETGTGKLFLEQIGCDFEMAAISLIFISQRAIKAWIIENCFISAMVNLMIVISKIFLYKYASCIFFLKFHPFVTRTDIKSGIIPQGRYWFWYFFLIVTVTMLSRPLSQGRSRDVNLWCPSGLLWS